MPDRHHAALPYAEVAGFIGKLRDGQAAPMTKLALEFLILTAARSTEARKARWDEVDSKPRPGQSPAMTRRPAGA